MQALRPKRAVLGAANRAKTALQQRTGLSGAKALDAARLRARAALQRLERLPIAASPAATAFQQYLQDRLSAGEDIEDFVREVKQRAAEEVDKRRHLVAALSEAVEWCRGSDRRHRLRTEVLQLARTGRIGASQAWDKVTEICATPYPFLSWAERRTGPLTIGLAMQIEGGAGVGGGGTAGICARPQGGMTCYFQQLSVCVGAVAEAEAALQLSVSAGEPEVGLGWGVEAGVGGGANATLSVTASLLPRLHRPSLQEPWICDYAFQGLAVSLGGGGGLDIGVAIGATLSSALTKRA